MKNELASWRVYPENPRVGYFTVRVFRTLAAMRKAAHVGDGSAASWYAHATGVCQGWRTLRLRNGRWAGTKERGQILFASHWLGTVIIAHEAAHAALRWAEWKKIEVAPWDGPHCSAEEERVCGCFGEIVRQIVDGCYSHGLLKAGRKGKEAKMDMKPCTCGKMKPGEAIPIGSPTLWCDQCRGVFPERRRNHGRVPVEFSPPSTPPSPRDDDGNPAIAGVKSESKTLGQEQFDRMEQRRRVRWVRMQAKCAIADMARACQDDDLTLFGVSVLRLDLTPEEWHTVAKEMYRRGKLDGKRPSAPFGGMGQ